MNCAASQSQKRWDFDSLKNNKPKNLFARAANPGEISQAYAVAQKNVDFNIVPISEVDRVFQHNKNNLHVITDSTTIVGIYALVMLNLFGLEQLLLEEFDFSQPHNRYLATEYTQPAAIYKWLVVAPNLGASAFICMSNILNSPLYRNTNLFARPASSAGQAVMNKLGFEPIHSSRSQLHRYIRAAYRHH